MIELDYDGKLAITIFENEYKTTPIQHANTSVSQFYSILSEPRIGPKKSNSCFVGGTVHPTRNNKNVLNRTVLTFDFDDIPNDIDLFSQISETFDYSFAMYSTHNHSDEKPRFRLVVPLDREYQLDQHQYRAVIKHLANDVFDTPFIDPASEVLSQVMFLPTCNDKSNFVFKYVDEELFNLDSTLKTVKTVSDSAEDVRMDKSHWIELLNGKGHGGRNQACAQLSGHLLRHYIDPYVALELVTLWNERNNPPLDNKELMNTFNSILRSEQSRRSEDRVKLAPGFQIGKE